MTQREQMEARESQGTARQAYSAKMLGLHILLKKIDEALVDHVQSFKAQGQTSWASVGDLDRYHEQLKDVSDSLRGEGEYAD